ncbi:hypothetical protein [Embleya sp. NPDC020886]|uniref:hypothetical protein n=1 Tax=Embleya sp. NPDC020886 TaxID=3363980 RepID=UPI0037A7CF79
MGNRPTDWNAIGLSTDPTPGDPVRLDTLITSMESLGRVAREIDEALNSVLDKTGKGAFVGQTADALRDKISGPLREFVTSIADAFENSAKALRPYADTMREQQRTADAALTTGRDLAPEDPQRAEHGKTARAAGTILRTQAETAAKVLNSSATGIKQPVSGCDLFWEAFNWLAIILILPALLLGGPLALLAIGINLVLFVKTAVDVANGKAGLLDLFLAGLGMIAPTTKGLNLLKLFKDGAKFIWDKGLKGFVQGAWGALKGAFGAGAFRSFAFIPGLKDFARLAGGWVKSGALWVGGAVLKFPSWAAGAFTKGGLAVVQGFKAIPALFRGLPGMIKGAAGSTWKFLKSELGGSKWLRLILPVDAAEISRFGLKRALQIGFYERGVLGKFRFASPLLSAGGRGLSQIPTPPLHGVGALPEMPVGDLARIRAGDWSGFGANELRMNALDLPTTNLTVTSPGGLHVPASLGEVMQFAPDAVRRMDALVDLGARDMRMVQIGDWAKLPTPANSGRLELNAVHSVGQLSPTTGAAGAVHALPTPSALPSVTHTPSPTSLSALDLVHNGGTQRLNLPSALTGNLPGGATGIGHVVNPSLNHGLTTPGLPAVGAAGHALPAPNLTTSGLTNHGLTNHGLAGPGLPGHGAPGPHVEFRPTEFGSSANPSAPSPTALAGGPPPTAPVPDHAGNALNLLDHGPKTPLRSGSPADAGALPPVPPPHGPGGGAELRPGTPNANQVAVAPPTAPGNGLTGPSNRLTGAQLEQLWQRESDRIGALFGRADHPQWADRVEAWRDLTSARNELGRAQQVLHDLRIRPDGPSTPSVYERNAGIAVETASTKVETALTRLDSLGVDPARIDKGMAELRAQSLLERPRLVGGSHHDLGGGSGGGTLPPTSAAGSVVPPNPNIAPHVGPGATLPEGAVVHIPVNDGYRTTDPATGRSIRYGNDGHVLDEGLALHSPNEPRFIVDDGAGRPVLTDVHGTPVTGVEVTVVGGGYRVTETTGGHTVRYGTNGAVVDRGIALRSTLAPHVVVHSDARPPVLTNAHGEPITDHTFASFDGGYRVTDPATGSSVRYGTDGRVADRGIVLHGTDNAHFVVRGEHGPVLTDVHGTRITDVDVTSTTNGGHRITEPNSGQTTRYRADGSVAEHGIALEGLGDTRIVVPREGRNPVLTDTHGKPVSGTAVTTLDNGFRVTDTTTGRSIRYGGDGTILEHGIALQGTDNAHFVVRGEHGPVLTDVHGTRITDVDVTSTTNGGHRITEPNSGQTTRYRADGSVAEHGIALTGSGDTHFVVFRDGRPPVLTDVHGKPTTTHDLADLTGGYRVTDPATGHSVRYDGNGVAVERGLALTEVGEPHFIVNSGTGHVLTNAQGAHVPNVEVNPLTGGGYRVTETGGTHSTRYTADGWVAEHGIVLGGTGEPRFLVGSGDHRHLTDTLGAPIPHHTATVTDQGFRVINTRTSESTLHSANGAVVEHGIAVGGPGEARFVVGEGAGRVLTDANGARVTDRAITVVDNGYRVTDPATGHSFRYDTANNTFEHGTKLGRAGQGPFAVGDTLTDLHGNPLPAEQRLTRLTDADGTHTGYRVDVVHPNTPRHGEFHEFGTNGTVSREGFNVLDDGRMTKHQYVVDHSTPTPTWRQEFHPDSPGDPFTRNEFQRGTVDTSGAANGGLRLKSSSPDQVTIFERRMLPGGSTLDAFRRTDLSGFGTFSHRTKWIEWGADGTPLGQGSRKFDTSGFGYTDVNEHFVVVREFRDTLQKFDGRAGHTLGVKGTDGWTWHRYDGAGNELANGPRTSHWDGGWSDRHGPGAGTQAGELVQKQWGPMHRTDHARHYLEHPLDGAGIRKASWDELSPQGKETGKHEVKADGSTFTTNRISEQRPPNWARKWLSDHRTEPTGNHAFLASDTRYQVFTWEKSAPDATGNLVPHSNGVRFVGDDGSSFDTLADGTFARSQTKLADGTTLKAGDSVTPHANAPAGTTPWNRDGVTGYRLDTPGGPDGRNWQDLRPVTNADGAITHWEMVREGFENGNVRHYATPEQPVHGAPGAAAPQTPVAPNPRSNWVEYDAHGYVAGRRDTWTLAAGNEITIVAHGSSTAKTWTWQRLDDAGRVQESGKRVLFRSSDDPKLPFDDSFRDFDAGNNLVRERRMLDSGRYVDAWQAPGADAWRWQKFDRAGNPLPPATAGTHERVWWNPKAAEGAGAWQATPLDGKNLLFRDRLVPTTPGETLVIRETPPHITDAPARVREYGPGGATSPNTATWTEFDHGTAVRTRTATADGHFLERDAWRGQWRRYDGEGHLLARRTDGGAVITTDSLNRWRVVGSEYDFRGQVTEVRGWVRRIREGQRMPWTGHLTGIDATQFRTALTGIPGIPTTGSIHLAEAAYQGGGTVLGKKLAVEFAQEFAIEFTANIIVADINARAQGKSLSETDWQKAALNAAVGGVVKGGVGAFVHENKWDGFRKLGDLKSGYGNIDGGKHWNRRPGNHDKTWANEWAGNETALRWRSGIYDFNYNAGVGLLAGLVNGSINASVFGIKGADGLTHKLSGWEAFGDGAIASLSGVVSTGSVSLARIGFLNAAGGRFFHRAGVSEFLLNIGFKIGEKMFNGWLLPQVRAGMNPDWYQQKDA